MKIVLIGNLGHTFVALSTLRRHSELQLCGIASVDKMDRNNLNELCREFNCRLYEDYQIMLDAVKPDIAIVGTRFDLNGPVSAECLKRGINCFTEKSIAHNFTILEQLKEAAAAGHAKIIGMHTMRYEPNFLAARQAVASEAIGKPMMIYARKSYKFGNTRPEFYKQHQYYGGTILWVAIHAVDLAIWVGGDIDKICAFHSSENNFDYGECEAATAIAFSFKNGGVGTITADFYQPDKAKKHGDDQLRVAGEKGVVEVLNEKAYITTHDKPKRELPLPLSRDFFFEFCSELQGAGQCLLSMEDTFKTTELALRARAFADNSAVN
jgi:predicted dehydrogenase